MGSLTLNIRFNRNEGLALSPSELIDLYLAGIPLCYPDGTKITMDSIKQKILNAQKQVENYLSVKLKKQVIWESHDFIRNEFTSWGYIKTVFPITEPLKLNGHINEVKQTSYPKDWISVKRGNDKTKFRNLYLIPNTKGGATMTNHSLVYSGITPHLGFFGTNYIPNYWRVKYITGWDKIPIEIVSVIGKFVAVQILAIAGDLVFGAGIGNQSISIDGISQSYSTTKGNQGAFGGRIKQYTEELVNELKDLRAEYYGMRFNVM